MALSPAWAGRVITYPVAETASAALALIEGALLLARVSGQASHLTNAKRAAVSLLTAPPNVR